MLIAGQGVPLVSGQAGGADRRAVGAAGFWTGGVCRAGRVPLFAWQAGGVAGRRMGGAAGCRQDPLPSDTPHTCCWSQTRGVGSATGQGVLLGGATGQGVLLVAGKRCWGCRWAGGAAGCR